MNPIKYNILLLALMISALAVGQTTNIGELTISPNTQVSIVDNFSNEAIGSTMNDGELFVYANFNNDGLFSYFNAANNGLTRFQGTSVQQISGTALSEFYDVYFNNTSTEAFQLSGDISIVNEADFDLGVVNNNDFGGNIMFQNLAYHSNTSDASHVKGQVIKKGDTAFEFPIGDSGYYRMAAITAPNDSNEVINGQYVLENSNTLYPHNLVAGVIDIIDNAEYWIINREQGNTNVVLTLSWNINTTPAEIVADNTSEIHIVRWDETQGIWVDEGGIVDDSNQTVTTIANISGYGVFTLARVKEDFILPGDVVIYNSVTPNGDGDNSFFFIDGLERFPDNSVTIFNRWGVKVYETTGYNETDNVFRGVSEGRITINKNEQLPTGTYFYILRYNTGGAQPQNVKKAGYLYINKDDN
ncbi:conserved exported hypothetical protein [Tenacibaculum sediminilitoris]|uniref:gliding motility-associated C-terminal domain-containing protein n=1 Tax=Tenacibaculum sediminilitoris TaxID=1820334 RepID=UPI003893500F